MSRAASPFAAWLDSPRQLDANRHPATDAQLPVLVVGAGPAGLAAMSQLRAAQVMCESVESHSAVGGIWDASNPLSTVYEGLHTVTSRYTSHLGVPVPDEWPDYPHHAQVREYFEDFARQQGLLPAIRFATCFESARRTERGTWLARLQPAGGEAYEAEFRALVIATGAHNRLHAHFPQPLRDEAVAAGLQVSHSAEYRSPAAFAGKRVLVVGMGNSGSDIAEKISAVAQRTLLSVRTHPWINPPTVGGVPCDKMAADGTRLPHWLAMTFFHAARQAAVGGFRALGLKRPRYGLNDRLPISDRGIVQAIRGGRVLIRSNVTAFRQSSAHFADPRQPPEPLDAVVFATGFARHYPLLPNPEGRRDLLLFHVFHREEPGLAYMSEPVGLHSCWPIFLDQARAIAAYFAAEQFGSSRIAQFNARRSWTSPNMKGRLFRLADEYHVDYRIYSQVLRDLAQWLGDAGARTVRQVGGMHVPAAP